MNTRLAPTLTSATMALVLLSASGTAAPRGDSMPSRPAGMGSALELEFTLKPDALRPFDPVTLLACVTNQNPSGRRSVEDGDIFKFEFTRGSLLTCSAISLAMPDAQLSESDFTCVINSNTVEITYQGEDAPWTPGQGVCALTTYSPADRPTTVLTSAIRRRSGGQAPGAAVGVLLAVAPDLGVEGPPGPTGAMGPQGPRGSGAIGDHFMRSSETYAIVNDHEPPVVIPDLDITVETDDGASLLVVLDATSGACSGLNSAEAIVYIELDGAQVASRLLEYGFTTVWNGTVTWMSPPLAAGAHRVRALVGGDGSSTGTVPNPVRCIGGPGLHRHHGTSRLVVMEMLP